MTTLGNHPLARLPATAPPLTVPQCILQVPHALRGCHRPVRGRQGLFWSLYLVSRLQVTFKRCFGAQVSSAVNPAHSGLSWDETERETLLPFVTPTNRRQTVLFISKQLMPGQNTPGHSWKLEVTDKEATQPLPAGSVAPCFSLHLPAGVERTSTSGRLGNTDYSPKGGERSSSLTPEEGPLPESFSAQDC